MEYKVCALFMKLKDKNKCKKLDNLHKSKFNANILFTEMIRDIGIGWETLFAFKGYHLFDLRNTKKAEKHFSRSS